MLLVGKVASGAEAVDDGGEGDAAGGVCLGVEEELTVEDVDGCGAC